MKAVALLGVVLLPTILLLACPSPAPSPVVPPTPDADSASPPMAIDVSVSPDASFEERTCAALADAGCVLGASPSCPATLAANKVPGGYLTTWAACLYGGQPATSCAVPCSPSSH
jgi:hypothetical protein